MEQAQPVLHTPSWKRIALLVLPALLLIVVLGAVLIITKP